MEQKLKIITYTTDPANENLAELLKSTQYPIDVVIGNEAHWSWDFLDKSKNILRQVQTISEPDQPILVIDAFDVGFSCPLESVDYAVRSFVERSGFDVVFNGEVNCYPEKKYEKLYPFLDKPYPFLNAGVYCGKASAIELMLKDVVFYIEKTRRIDQQVLSELYLGVLPKQFGGYTIGIDTNATVFQTMYQVPENNVVRAGGVVYNRKTQTYPCVIHGNGKSKFKHLLK
jgi:hypothetical protein